jgi:3-deoxy-manno-octulosonate cytidylyltransferase (CMP-KDO synthetase)
MDVFERLVVATDSEQVRDLCRRMGAPVLLTDPNHPTGTDRVAEVAEHVEFRDFPVVVNVQGDEPLIREDDVSRAVALVRDQGWDVATCASPVRTEEARQDPSVVKVAVGREGGALYFSRAPIPHRRDGTPGPEELAAPPFLRHVGIYVYRREALFRWVGLPPSPLEELERLEQLRALEGGLRIGVALVEGAGPGVDTPADVARMEEMLAELEPLRTPEDGP